MQEMSSEHLVQSASQRAFLRPVLGGFAVTFFATLLTVVDGGA